MSKYPHFFFNDTATTEIYTLSLHDALPICDQPTCLWIGPHDERYHEDGREGDGRDRDEEAGLAAEWDHCDLGPKLIRASAAGEGGYVSPPDEATRLDPGTPRVAGAVGGARRVRGRGAAGRAHARPRLRHEIGRAHV